MRQPQPDYCNMKHLLAFILLSGFFQQGLMAQNSQKLEAMVAAGEKAFHAHQISLARNHFTKALADSTIKNNQSVYIKALKGVGHLHNIKGMYDQGFQQYLKALVIAQKTNDYPQQGVLFGDIASLYAHLQNFQKALEYANKGLDMASKRNLPKIEKSLLTVQGSIYTALNQPNKALDSEQKALNIAKTLQDTVMFVKTYNNLANIYAYMGDYSQAKQYFFKAIKLQHPDSERMAHLQSNLSNVYIRQQKYDSSLVYLNKAIQLAQKQPVDWVLGVMYNKMARIYHLKKEFDTSENYYQKSMAILRKTDDPLGAVQTYQGIAANYAAQKQFEKAFEAHKRFKTASDSLYRQQKLERINGLEQSYVNAQKQKTITQLEKKTTLQGRLLLTIGVILVLLSAVFILIVHRNRLKRALLEHKSELLAKENAFNKSETLRLEMERRLRQKENQQLKFDLDYKTRELTSSALLSYQNVEVLNNIQEIVKDLKPKLPKNKELQEEFGQIQQIIKNNTHIEKSWDRFKLHFDEVHPLFFDQLVGVSSNLSQNDLRLSAYIRLNMSNKEIGQLLNIEFSSVQMAKYRLKKKLALAKDCNLNEFIQQL